MECHWCSEEFDPSDSCSNYPEVYCSEDCEQDSEAEIGAFDNDPGWNGPNWGAA